MNFMRAWRIISLALCLLFTACPKDPSGDSSGTFRGPAGTIPPGYIIFKNLPNYITHVESRTNTTWVRVTGVDGLGAVEGELPLGDCLALWQKRAMSTPGENGEESQAVRLVGEALILSPDINIEGEFYLPNSLPGSGRENELLFMTTYPGDCTGNSEFTITGPNMGEPTTVRRESPGIGEHPAGWTDASQ